jgi:uncharacterized protein YkvS
VFVGGNFVGTVYDVIDFVEYSTFGKAVDFGDVLQNTLTQTAACSNSTRGIIAGGYDDTGPGVRVNVIQYITIASVGNAIDFGDLNSTSSFGAAFSSTTRGVIGLGRNDAGTKLNTIEYVTIASAGNSIDFGDLLAGTQAFAGCANATRGVFAGGEITGSEINVIQYVTIASAGNTTDFGDLTIAREAVKGASSSTRAVFSGGIDSGTYYNVVDYVTISSTGNAADFGDMSGTISRQGGCSNAHGGL